MTVLANLRLCRSGRGGGFRAKFSLVGESGKDVFGYGEARVSRARLPVPAPLAGRRIETGTTRAGAPSRAAPRPAHGRPVSTTVRAVSRPEPAHNRCLRLAGATPAAAHKRRRSESRAVRDAQSRHRDERECTLREESSGSTASVGAESPPHRLPPSRCRGATRRRTDTVPPRH